MKKFRSANQVLVSKRLDVWRAPMPFAEAGEQDINESVRPVARCYNVPLVAKSALSPLILVHKLREDLSMVSSVDLILTIGTPDVEVWCRVGQGDGGYTKEELAELERVALAVRERLLTEAFLGRAACLVCWDYENCSQPEFDSGELLVDEKRRPVKVSRQAACSNDLLSRIADCWDYSIALLWLVGTHIETNERAVKELSFYANDGGIVGGPEIMLSADDGWTVHWSNPSVPNEQIEKCVRKLAGDVGCELLISDGSK